MTDTTTNTGRRTGLDQADMVATALTLVENEGPGALTMRRLAAELDVTTNTVYWHVGSRDALITEIIRTSATRLANRAITGTTPRERIHTQKTPRGGSSNTKSEYMASRQGGEALGALHARRGERLPEPEARAPEADDREASGI